MKYLSEDGKIFSTEKECKQYEEKLKNEEYFSNEKGIKLLDHNLKELSFDNFAYCCYFSLISDDIAEKYSKYLDSDFGYNCPNKKGFYMLDERTGYNVTIDSEIKKLDTEKKRLLDIIEKLK